MGVNVATIKNLPENLAYIYGLKRYTKTPSLRVMEKLVSSLGQPHHAYPTIHITGTVGKGSVASFIAQTLQQAGLRVALFTSPHLHRFNERIAMSGQPIADERLLELITQLRRRIRALRIRVAFFEFTTALAFSYFAEEKADIAVIEAGLGGLNDPTNVIQPELSIITQIGLDHTNILGTTKRAIAHDKAGIIKEGIPIVTAERDPAVVEYLRQISHARHAPLYHVHENLHVHDIEASREGQTFKVYRVLDQQHERYRIRLLGRHQITNALTALHALDILNERGIPVSRGNLKEGLANTRWEGRLEIVARTPLVVVDGAHNEDGAYAVHAFLQESFVPQPEVLILAQKKDKPNPVMQDVVAPLFKQVIVTEGAFQPLAAEKLAVSLRSTVSSVHVIPDPEKAVAEGMRRTPKNGLLLITGSLYMIGNAIIAVRKIATQQFLAIP